MKKIITFLCLFSSVLVFGKNMKNNTPQFIAIHHASLIIKTGNINIFVDPVGHIDQYRKYGHADLILYTHDHSDHLDVALFKKLVTPNTTVIGPARVIQKTGIGKVLNNNETYQFKDDIQIDAIPAYNTTPDRLKFHPKGVGNGYVITIQKRRIYISGDTEDIPEMRALKNIDDAFVCMNLPYTMSVEQAASAILQMKPQNLYPYHYRNQDGTFSDIHGKLKKLLSVDPNIKIHYLKWY